mmetsp:Transcript_32801/g.110540  ORF Transcript_32801/g.110540 Transcript_32801/m.110540 type:complete len:246 (+) Transcript_32801:256-993(+)
MMAKIIKSMATAETSAAGRRASETSAAANFATSMMPRPLSSKMRRRPPAVGTRQRAMATRSASPPKSTASAPNTESRYSRHLTSPSPATLASEMITRMGPPRSLASRFVAHAARAMESSRWNSVPGEMWSASNPPLSPPVPLASTPSARAARLPLRRRSRCVTSLARGAGPSTKSARVWRALTVAPGRRASRRPSSLPRTRLIASRGVEARRAAPWISEFMSMRRWSVVCASWTGVDASKRRSIH